AVVISGRSEAAATDRRRYGEPGLRLLQFDRAVHTIAGALLLRDDARPLGLRHIVGSVVHLEWDKDVLAEIILELLAGHRLDQLADDVGRGAVVPALARIEQQRAAERIGFAGVRLEIAPDGASERIGQSGRVRQEMPDGRRLRCRTDLVVAGPGVEGFNDLQS